MLAVPEAQGAFPGANGKIAFTSDREGSYRIYTVDSAGAQVRARALKYSSGSWTVTSKNSPSPIRPGSPNANA